MKNDKRLMTKDELRSFTSFLIFDSQQKDIESYVNRGRSFQYASLGHLNEQYLLEMKRWASTFPPWEPSTRLHDIESEFALRKIAPPGGVEVLDCVNTINATIERATKEQPQESNQTYLDDRLREYDEMRAKKN